MKKLCAAMQVTAIILSGFTDLASAAAFKPRCKVWYAYFAINHPDYAVDEMIERTKSCGRCRTETLPMKLQETYVDEKGVARTKPLDSIRCERIW